MEHQSEFEKIRQETDRAIEKGFDAAHTAWREMALDKVCYVCMMKEEFTANDVREYIEESGITTHDKRAMGGVMVTAKKFGWIEPTGRSIPSRVGHKTPLQIWRSLIYKTK